MKKLLAGVLVAVAVLAIAVVAGLDAGQTSADTEVGSSAPADVVTLKANTDSGEADDNGKTPYIGVTIRTLSAEEAGELGIPGGVEVVSVLDGSPAAGILSRGDVITAIDGEAVSSAEDVVTIVQAAAPGTVLM